MVNRNVNYRIAIIPGSKVWLSNSCFKVGTTLHVNKKVYDKYTEEFSEVIYNDKTYTRFCKFDKNSKIRYYISIHEVVKFVSSLDELQYKLHDLRKYSLELNNKLKK